MRVSLTSFAFTASSPTNAHSFICSGCRRASSTLGKIPQPRHRPIHGTALLSYPRKRDFFSYNASLRQKQIRQELVTEEAEETTPAAKLKKGRSPGVKPSLRRAAIEAQRSMDGISTKSKVAGDRQLLAKIATAYCVAEQFDLSKVLKILREKGYTPDPFNTGLYPQVVHVQVPTDSIWKTSPTNEHTSSTEAGDIFIFPSGTIVTWSLPEGFTSYFATRTLLPAATNEHVAALETEDMEYMEDSSKDHSSIKGDTIVLGTKADVLSSLSGAKPDRIVEGILTKVAFSSGLARSTKLAVLESLLENYFDSTRSIPTLLSRGSRLPFTRSFILRKTGQLLSVRAQLNLYSELTDSLPDLFWDSRHELGLEGYYDQVGKALDVGIRIKTLNEKMDYAQEIAAVLRERLSEKHGLVLEWTIIALIAVEVGFEVLRLWKESIEKAENAEMLEAAL